MRTLVLVLISLTLQGCNQLPTITLGKAKVRGVADAGKPAVLNSNEIKTTLDVPAQTKVVVTETDPSPATETSPYLPKKIVTEWAFTQPAKLANVSSSLFADTGTVDTTTAKHKIDVASRVPLLYASIGAALLAGVAVFLKYPTVAVACGAGSAVFFVAWKLSDLPSWFYVLGVAAVLGGLGLYFGHERAERSVNK